MDIIMALIPTNYVKLSNVPDIHKLEHALEEFNTHIVIADGVVEIKAELHLHEEIYGFAFLIGKAVERGAIVLHHKIGLNQYAH